MPGTCWDNPDRRCATQPAIYAFIYGATVAAFPKAIFVMSAILLYVVVAMLAGIRPYIDIAAGGAGDEEGAAEVAAARHEGALPETETETETEGEGEGEGLLGVEDAGDDDDGTAVAGVAVAAAPEEDEADRRGRHGSRRRDREWMEEQARRSSILRVSVSEQTL